MGEAQALKKAQSVILAGVLAMTLGCGISAGAKAYADEGLQAGATELTTQIKIPEYTRVVFPGKTIQVSLTNLTAGQTGTWSVKSTKADHATATIDENGVVSITGKGAGKTKVIATFTTNDYGMKDTKQFFIKVTGIANGKTSDVKNANSAKDFTYKVLKNTTKTGGAAKVMSALNKDAAKIKVPKTVAIEKGNSPRTYKVRSIASYAFNGMSKLKYASIGENVMRIGSKAFKGTQVKTVTINTKLLKAAKVKNCFKGSKVTTVKVPADKVKAYSKIFTKDNCGKTVKVVAAK